MKEQVILFETAKLAKEKGFNEKCIGFWHENEGGIDLHQRSNATHSNFYYHKHSYFAPTQSLLQKWLREKYNIHIGIWYNNLTEEWRIDYIYNIKDTDQDIRENIDDEEYLTYEEALEAALQEALKLIK